MQKRKYLISLATLLFVLFFYIQSSFAYSNTTLKMGMMGPSVTMLQKDLKTLGFMNTNPTGYFGSSTKDSLILFQKKNGFTQDGIAGPQTLSKIDLLLGRASAGSRGDYDRDNSYVVPGVNKQWIPGLPQNPYNNGIGMYEGVVLHYTANPHDTAQIEANYMKNNWGTAFVHEFVDSKQIIQIANPDYTCWGAGPNANHRFIQIELCDASTRTEFNKSFSMWCERAAEYLYARKLGVSPAKSDGTGTLWSHNNVTQYLGGTDHTDPDSYLSKWGKTWKDVINTVTQDYNNLAAKYH